MTTHSIASRAAAGLLLFCALAHASICPTTSKWAVVPNTTTGKAVLVVGQTVDLTGPAARAGVAVRAGLDAAFASANEASAVQFALSSLDDASSVMIANQNLNTLLMIFEEMASRGVSGVTYIGNTWYMGEDIYSTVPKSTWAKLSGELRSSVYFSQLVPMPTNPDLLVAKEYRMAMDKYHPELNYSHASFEGFISGRLIVMAAAKALELHRWPLTRANFLDAIFREARTFDVYGYKLGPYGDGIGSAYSPQTVDDWCNQGSHEVFMTKMSLDTGELSEEASSSFKFAGCGSWNWNKTAARTVVGFTSLSDTAADRSLHTGIDAALGSYNSNAQDRVILLTSLVSGARVAFTKLAARQEAKAAAKFLVKENNISVIEIVCNKTSHGSQCKDFYDGIEWSLDHGVRSTS
eukprot:m51a1_g10853 hypothetical protein (408) ;mRNA; f:17337-19374